MLISVGHERVHTVWSSRPAHRAGRGLHRPHPVPRPASRPTSGPGSHAHAVAPVDTDAGGRPFTLVASGEIIASPPDVLATAQDDAPHDVYDYRPMLKGVRPVISSADLALCHLGAPFGPVNGPFTDYPVLQAPPQLATAASTTDGRPDIDLIVGTGAHTPQPYEKVNGTWVVYGLGDQISGAMKKPRGNWGSIARFRFAPPDGAGARWRVTRAEYLPQPAEQKPRVRMRTLARNGGHGRIRKKISKAVLSRGAAADGLTLGRGAGSPD
ncbi:CapA family protein [Streptomyces decoyicus]|uniref:CapA family protein n=1 Tax=Streptomyces decoyicus TaxID=249567 RepID=UPI001FD74CAF|nr:CapA family protein [Streptomyces decoyicus]